MSTMTTHIADWKLARQVPASILIGSVSRPFVTLPVFTEDAVLGLTHSKEKDK